jgi:hypothetical protein
MYTKLYILRLELCLCVETVKYLFKPRKFDFGNRAEFDSNSVTESFSLKNAVS